MSVSSMPVEMPCLAAAKARLMAMVLLPTPPLALLTATTFLTLATGRFSGKPEGCQRLVVRRRSRDVKPLFMRAARFGGVPERGRP